MVIFIAVPAIMYGQSKKKKKYIKALKEQGVSRSQIINFDENGIPRISTPARPIKSEKSFAKSRTSATVSDDLPSELRAWEAIPGVIRNDGKETFRLEVELNQEVSEVRLESQFNNPTILGPEDYPIELKDDGKGEDRVAGDQVYTAGPFRWNTEKKMDTYYGDGENVTSSPKGVDFVPPGPIYIETPTGETEQFLVQPQVGVLRKDIPNVEVQKIAEDVQVSSHFINVESQRRNLQIAMHAPYEVRESGGYGTGEIFRRIYELMPDVFHFLNYVSTNYVETRPGKDIDTYGNFIAGQHLTIRTDYTGIGEGGTGHELYSDTILGTNKLGVANRGLNASTATHELFHQWAAYLNPDLGISTGSHYLRRTSAASLLSGYTWLQHSDSTFTLDCRSEGFGIAKPPPLDLYLMGLIPGDEVPPIYVAKESVYLANYCEPFERIANPVPPDTLTPSEIERVVTIEDIQEVHGVRRPGPENAQRNFRIGYVGSSHDRLLNETEMTFYNILAKHRGSEAEQPNYLQGTNTWTPLQGYFRHGTSWNTEIPQNLEQKEPKPVSDLQLETTSEKIQLSWEGWTENSTTKYIINKGKSTSQMVPVDTVDPNTKTYQAPLDETVFYSIQPINKYGHKSPKKPVVSYFDKTVNLPTNRFRTINSPLEKEKQLDDEVTLYRFNNYYRYGNILQEPEDGYWIMGSPKDTLQFVGEGVEKDRVYIYEGWNLIGGLADTVKIASIIDPEQVLDKTPVYTYDAEQQKYVEASVMAPFRAHWIYGGKDNKDGEFDSKIIVRDITRKSEEEVYRFKQKPGRYDHILFTSKGSEKKIYYSKNELTEDTRHKYLLPPQAPGISLDVRTEGGFRIADGQSVELYISADQYPVYVSVEKNQVSSTGYKLVGVNESKPDVEIPLYEGQTEELTKDYDHIYLKKSTLPERPKKFKLSANYPNPFNPTTTIQYQVPKQADVLIEVYNILGQRAKTLVNENKQPGEYTINFNGSRLASGIYFLRIEAGNFIDTQKMTLIK